MKDDIQMVFALSIRKMRLSIQIMFVKRNTGMCMLFVSYYLKMLYSKKLLESVHFLIPWFNEFRLIRFRISKLFIGQPLHINQELRSFHLQRFQILQLSFLYFTLYNTFLCFTIILVLHY